MIITNKVLNVDDYYFDVFMSISQALTGFTLNELQSTGLTETYYNYILNHLQAETFIEFLTVSKNVLENSFTENQLKNAIVSEIVMNPGMNDIADKIIILWHLGTWEGIYINEQAYQDGWAVNVI
ncbi:hypothetical protein [Chryseobacterium indologenes]|uniref:Uncharacterized protein n=1 Tax=Chryseobacterium indologenes TaxID=253 RepID=A0A0N0ZW30_CHRID|nr:hypothetical protein [Chryseobacterium indologenes]KPE52506.1 hypothetical protein AOB46_00300 [Chryseobacterium indologenes]